MSAAEIITTREPGQQEAKANVMYSALRAHTGQGHSTVHSGSNVVTPPTPYSDSHYDVWGTQVFHVIINGVSYYVPATIQ